MLCPCLSAFHNAAQSRQNALCIWIGEQSFTRNIPFHNKRGRSILGKDYPWPEILPQRYKADIQLSIGFIRKRKYSTQPVCTHIPLDMFAGQLASLMID